MITPEKTKVSTLGECRYRSPLTLSTKHGDGIGNFVRDGAHVRYQARVNTWHDEPDNVFFEKAGARERIFFNPSETRAAIVTCGGLCPGLNNVIRSVFRQCSNYGVKEVLGIRYGYQGLNAREGLPPIVITSEFVDGIDSEGGTVLGSSRGPQDVGIVVDFLQDKGINILFCVGGDGTQRGAHDISEEIKRRGASISIIGIPKTIDNDIKYITTSFGFNTAIEQVTHVLSVAHAEAKGARNGIGLVKVMGRESGFIAAAATLASQEVNFTLIPEVPFDLHGPNGFLPLLAKRIERKRHAVVVVAEGAGQELIPDGNLGRDASGNRKLDDIGVFLKNQVLSFFSEQQVPVTVKYIDPSYIIRGVPANCSDSLLCDRLSRRAVDSAMAGKTDCLIGIWNDSTINLPIPLAVEERQKVKPESDLWVSVYETTNQPLLFKAYDD